MLFCESAQDAFGLVVFIVVVVKHLPEGCLFSARLGDKRPIRGYAAGRSRRNVGDRIGTFLDQEWLWEGKAEPAVLALVNLKILYRDVAEAYRVEVCIVLLDRVAVPQTPMVTEIPGSIPSSLFARISTSREYCFSSHSSTV